MPDNQMGIVWWLLLSVLLVCCAGIPAPPFTHGVQELAASFVQVGEKLPPGADKDPLAELKVLSASLNQPFKSSDKVRSSSTAVSNDTTSTTTAAEEEAVGSLTPISAVGSLDTHSSDAANLMDPFKSSGSNSTSGGFDLSALKARTYQAIANIGQSDNSELNSTAPAAIVAASDASEEGEGSLNNTISTSVMDSMPHTTATANNTHAAMEGLLASEHDSALEGVNGTAAAKEAAALVSLNGTVALAGLDDHFKKDEEGSDEKKESISDSILKDLNKDGKLGDNLQDLIAQSIAKVGSGGTNFSEVAANSTDTAETTEVKAEPLATEHNATSAEHNATEASNLSMEKKATDGLLSKFNISTDLSGNTTLEQNISDHHNSNSTTHHDNASVANLAAEPLTLGPPGEVVTAVVENASDVVPIFIIFRDRLSHLKECIASIKRRVDSPYQIVIHNHETTYQPAMQYLNTLKQQGIPVYTQTLNTVQAIRALNTSISLNASEVEELREQTLHLVRRTIKQYREEHGPFSFYVVTDADMELAAETPGDILWLYEHILETEPQVVAIGPSLITADLPDGPLKPAAVEEEEAHSAPTALEKYVVWEEKAKKMFLAPLDTNFAMYRGNWEFKRHNIVNASHPTYRTDVPYAAYHLDWWVDVTNVTEDMQWYWDHSLPITKWSAANMKHANENRWALANHSQQVAINATQALLHMRPKDESNTMTAHVKSLAAKFLKGDGLEVAVLKDPTPVPRGVDVKFVQRNDLKTIKEEFPLVAEKMFVETDIVDDPEIMTHVANESADFVIGNHFLQRTENLMGTIKNHMDKLRLGGVLFYTTASKVGSIDEERASSSWEEVLADEQDGGKAHQAQRYLDWVVHVLHNITDPESEAKHLSQRNLTHKINFYVWDHASLSELVHKMKEHINSTHPFDILTLESVNDSESVLVLKKLQPYNATREAELKAQAEVNVTTTEINTTAVNVSAANASISLTVNTTVANASGVEAAASAVKLAQKGSNGKRNRQGNAPSWTWGINPKATKKIASEVKAETTEAKIETKAEEPKIEDSTSASLVASVTGTSANSSSVDSQSTSVLDSLNISSSSSSLLDPLNNSSSLSSLDLSVSVDTSTTLNISSDTTSSTASALPKADEAASAAPEAQLDIMANIRKMMGSGGESKMMAH